MLHDSLRRPVAGLAIAASLVLAALAPVAAQDVPTSGGNNRDGVANASAQDGDNITFDTSDGTTSTTGGSGTVANIPRIPTSNVASARLPVVSDANGPDGVPIGATTSTSTPATVNGQPVENGTYIPDQTPPPAPVSDAPVADDGSGVSDAGSGDAAPVDDSGNGSVDDGSGAVADDGSGTTDDGSADAAPADTGNGDDTAPQYTCADFISWYDAQSTYDARGGTGQDWQTVDAVDPDWNGVACEDLPGGPAAAA